jgi:hypothetical protein
MRPPYFLPSASASQFGATDNLLVRNSGCSAMFAIALTVGATGTAGNGARPTRRSFRLKYAELSAISPICFALMPQLAAVFCDIEVSG